MSNLQPVYTTISLWMSLLQCDLDQLLSSIYYTTKVGLDPISKKPNITIIIFIEVEIVDGAKGFLLSIIVRLVGMTKSYVLTTTSQFRGVG